MRSRQSGGRRDARCVVHIAETDEQKCSRRSTVAIVRIATVDAAASLDATGSKRPFFSGRQSCLVSPRPFLIVARPRQRRVTRLVRERMQQDQDCRSRRSLVLPAHIDPTHLLLVKFSHKQGPKNYGFRAKERNSFPLAESAFPPLKHSPIGRLRCADLARIPRSSLARKLFLAPHGSEGYWASHFRSRPRPFA